MPESTQVTNSEDISFHPENFFNQQWKIYEKMLNNNYLGHREIYSVLHSFLVSYFQTPFKMLEFGCGDASFTAHSLLNTRISNYQGINLSAPALEIAKQNLAAIQCNVTLTKGDFSQLILELPQGEYSKFDVILISFALHHLSLAQKDCFIGQLNNLLAPGGVFILIDVICQEEEDRETYIRRYLDNVYKSWSLLTPLEHSMVEKHISTSDFPETQQTLDKISQKYNFARFECLYQDPLNSTQLLCFYL